jgi:hypothetical protein
MKTTSICAWLTTSALAIALGGPALAQATDHRTPTDPSGSISVGPSKEEVYIKAIAVNGTGCPIGSVVESMSDDRQSFTLAYSQFFAEAFPGSRYSDQYKTCNINVNLKVPQGWTYTISTVDFRGHAWLEPNIIGHQKASYYFTGSTNQPSAQTTFVGPYNSDYLIRDEVHFLSTAWAPCGEDRNLNIRASIQVQNYKNRYGRGIMTVDSTDYVVQQRFNLSWRRCTDADY